MRGVEASSALDALGWFWLVLLARRHKHLPSDCYIRVQYIYIVYRAHPITVTYTFIYYFICLFKIFLHTHTHTFLLKKDPNIERQYLKLKTMSTQQWFTLLKDNIYVGIGWQGFRRMDFIPWWHDCILIQSARCPTPCCSLSLSFSLSFLAQSVMTRIFLHCGWDASLWPIFPREV